MQAQPRLLHHVLGLDVVAEHPARDPHQARSFCLEQLRLIHGFNPSTSIGHPPDARARRSVTTLPRYLARHDRLASMVETVSGSSADEGIRAAAQLLHDFNREYDEPARPPGVLAPRLSQLVADGHITVLLALAHEDGAPVRHAGPSWPRVWAGADHRGDAGRARAGGGQRVPDHQRGRPARRLYEAAGFRRTEGEGGPLMLAYERDL
jgi:hypothetical protein